MRKKMEEKVVLEERAELLSERKQRGNELFEIWSKEKGVGEGLKELRDKDENKAIGAAIVLENQAQHLQALTETQISNAFQTTPENVLRIVRLGYPNSVRGEIFSDYPMVTARDSVYYLSPVYSASKRGATIDTVTHESPSYRYSSEVEEEEMTDAGAQTVYDLTVANAPLRPFSVKIFVNEEPVAVDDGAGNIVGTLLSAGSVNYDTGVTQITFNPAIGGGDVVLMAYNFDSEATTGEIQSVELQLRDYQLRAKPHPLYVSWTKMTELLLGTTLDIDVESSLVAGAADELKKSLDFAAVKMAYRHSLKNALVTFNADFAAAGADSEIAHAQSLTRTIAAAGKTIYNAVQRGGVNVIVAGVDACSYLTLHDKFDATGLQPEIGIYRIGTFLGKPVYQAPTSIIPADEMLGIWRNPNESADMAILFGSLIPLYESTTLEYARGYSEKGLFHFGDSKVLNSNYLVRMKLNNL